MDNETLVSRILVTNPSYFSTISSLRDDAPVNAARDMKALFSILLNNEIPGPRLLRLQTEFSDRLGHGGEGIVYCASEQYIRKILDLTSPVVGWHTSERIWVDRVVKRLRSDESRPYAEQVRAAYSEIKRLCDESFRKHPNIVKLQGWGICLDSLENQHQALSLMPLLILERAACDLEQFIRDSEYEDVSYEDLCSLSRDIGRGLEVVHRNGIAHGDMKPANVLLFPTKGNSDRSKWTAKLCDFGSAAIEPHGKAAPFQKRGSYHYWPPEYWLAENSVSAMEPRSLQACDIFAYGLVVWNIFSGIPFPPLSIEDTKEIALGKLGQQEYYRRASHSIRCLYDAERYQQTLCLMDSSIFAASFLGGRVHQALQRQRHHRLRRFNIGTSNKKVMELEVNRILVVLRECLNDLPELRGRTPWRYFNTDFYSAIPAESVPRLQPPTDGARDRSIIGHLTAAGKRLSKRVLPALRLMEMFGDNLKSIGDGFERQFNGWLAFWGRHSERQQSYEHLCNILRGCLPIGMDPHDQGLLSHSHEHGCYDINVLGKVLDDIASSLPGPYALADRHYALFRLRSRLQLCCWLNLEPFASAKITEYVDIGSSLADLPTLAWFLRGEIGQNDLERLQRKDATAIWTGLFKRANYISDNDMSLRVLLLFERGCSLQLEYRTHLSTIGLDSRRIDYYSTTVGLRNYARRLVKNDFRVTAFLDYLLHLRNGESALTVCRHFKRVASGDRTESWSYTFLTGQGVDKSDELGEEPSSTTTALHEAVKASNYAVVEYLVLTGFYVQARDQDGKSALDLAVESLHTDDARKPVENERIIALLQQNRDISHYSGLLNAGLPLGWEACLTIHTGVQAWRETSIESDHDAITFIQPKAGLWQDRRIALGQRRAQGTTGQVYYLDPLRFLRSTRWRIDRPEAATEPFFGEDWYAKDIEKTLEPPPLPPIDYLDDQRLWIRGIFWIWLTSKAAIFSSYGNLLLPVLPVAAISRFTHWSREVQLVFQIISTLFVASAFPHPSVTAVLPFRGVNLSNVLLDCLPEVGIGFILIARQQLDLAKNMLIGSILTQYTLALGLVGLVHGFYWRNGLLGSGLRIIAGLSLVGFNLSTILLVFVENAAAENSAEILDTMVLLSRGVAIVAILLWIGFLFLRFKTHADLFEEEAASYEENYDESAHEVNIRSTIWDILGPIPRRIFLVFYLTILVFFVDSFVVALMQFPPKFQATICTFAVPLLIRPMFYVDILVYARMNRIDTAIETSLRTGLCTALAVAPTLVIIGWMLSQPMTLVFSKVQTAAYGIAVWFVLIFVHGFRTNYLKGILLICIYILVAFALAVTMK